MLVLDSQDAKADAAAFAERASVVRAVLLRAQRTPARRQRDEVAFTLAFAHDSGSPKRASSSASTTFPENFWNPDFQRHHNKATRSAVTAGRPSPRSGFGIPRRAFPA